MVEKIGAPDLAISVEPARGRQTADNDFGSMVQRGAEKALGAVAGGARVAASLLPGGSFVTAVADAASAGIGGEVPGVGSDKWALLRAQERLQEEGLANSLRLLELQRKMHQETQTYTTVSNVMKARHEMAKAAINNVR